MIDTFLFSGVTAHLILASTLPQDSNLNTITSGLLDVLIVTLLLLAVAAFFSYRRSQQATQARGSTPRRAQRNISTITSIMLAVPVVWLLLVWGGTSLVQSSPSANQPTSTPTVKPGKMTPTPRSNPAVTLASELVNPKLLTVGSDTANPPQEFLDPNTQQPTGFDIDLINSIAQKMGLQAKIVNMPFNSLFKNLRNHQFDVVISAVSMTPDLTGKYDFVRYLHTSESLLLPAGNPKHIKQMTNLCGLSVGVQAGSTELTELQKATCPTGKMITIMQEMGEANVIQLLLNGTVDATYQETPAANYYFQQDQGQFDIVGILSNPPDEGIVVRKGDNVMFNAVQAALNQLKQDKTYSSLIIKWGLAQEELHAVIDQRSWSTVGMSGTLSRERDGLAYCSSL